MIDVKFTEAMTPLADKMFEAMHRDLQQGPEHAALGLGGVEMAAAVVEALGIPAQMVANKTFRRQLLLLVDACKSEADETPSVVENACKALERVFWWLAAGVEGPEGGLPELDYEMTSSEGKELTALQEQVRLAARGLGGLQDVDVAETLPPIRLDEPEAITAPGGPDFIPDPPACSGPNDNAT